MKKLLLLLASVILVLTACGGKNEESKDISKVESGSKQTESENDNNEGEKNEDKSEDTTNYDEVLLDSDNAKITLVSITKVIDKTYDEEYHSIKFAIENKLEETIVIQAEEVSLDDMMVDDEVFFSETVAGGKKANGEMKIQNYEGDLPSLEENIEFKLLVISDESYDRFEEPLVKIEIK